MFEDSAIRGFNVTIPYKESIMQFLDTIDEQAAQIGAVNTVKRNENGVLTGYNTDYIGFQRSLSDFVNWPSDKRSALILGTGGAAKAVEFALHDMGCVVHYVSRAKQKNNLTYEELNAEIIQKVDLIINTTPLGTFPDVESCPNIPYEHLTERQHLYDLVYNPELTKFLKFGLEKSCPIQNGLKMLNLQAEAAWEIWNSGQ